MTKLTRTLLFWTLILFACSPGISSPQTFPAPSSTNTPAPQPDTGKTIDFPTNVTTQVPIGSKIIVTVGTPNVGQGPDGNFPVTETSSDTCAFVWAHPILEELTLVFDSKIKELNTQAFGHASAFGEDCVYPDGRKVFLGFETDFYITLPVTELTDFESFGNWIAETMPVVNTLPPNMIEGSQSGFVEYRFLKTENEMLVIRVPLHGYEETANGMVGDDLFLLFYKEQ
jgi:hypothetical protein